MVAQSTLELLPLKPHSVALQVMGLSVLPVRARCTWQYWSAAVQGGAAQGRAGSSQLFEHAAACGRQSSARPCLPACLPARPPACQGAGRKEQLAGAARAMGGAEGRCRRTCAGQLLPIRGGAGVAHNIEGAGVDGLLHASALRQARGRGAGAACAACKAAALWQGFAGRNGAPRGGARRAGRAQQNATNAC